MLEPPTPVLPAPPTPPPPTPPPPMPAPVLLSLWLWPAVAPGLEPAQPESVRPAAQAASKLRFLIILFILYYRFGSLVVARTAIAFQFSAVPQRDFKGQSDGSPIYSSRGAAVLNLR